MRTFIELELPIEARDYIRQRLDEVCRVLGEEDAASCFRWTQIASVHLTLRFLGETSERQSELLEAGLEAVAKEWPPLSLQVSQLGGFPSVQRPRVVWLGIDGDLAGLHGIQASVEKLAQSCGFAAEDRPYSPHLTIARTKRDCSRVDTQRAGAILAQLAAPTPTTRAGSFSAGTLVHMRSDLRRSGAVYTPLSTHPLLG